MKTYTYKGKVFYRDTKGLHEQPETTLTIQASSLKVANNILANYGFGCLRHVGKKSDAK